MIQPKKLTEDLIKQKTRGATLNTIRNFNSWGCELTDVSIMEELECLEVAGFSVNNLTTLKDFQYCRNLTDLYVRKNCIKDISEIYFLKELNKLRNLMMSENPCCEPLGDIYRLTVIRNLPQLTKLDDMEITAKEVENAKIHGRIVNHPDAPKTEFEQTPPPKLSQLKLGPSGESGQANPKGEEPSRASYALEADVTSPFLPKPKLAHSNPKVNIMTQQEPNGFKQKASSTEMSFQTKPKIVHSNTKINTAFQPESKIVHSQHSLPRQPEPKVTFAQFQTNVPPQPEAKIPCAQYQGNLTHQPEPMNTYGQNNANCCPHPGPMSAYGQNNANANCCPPPEQMNTYGQNNVNCCLRPEPPAYQAQPAAFWNQRGACGNQESPTRVMTAPSDNFNREVMELYRNNPRPARRRNVQGLVASRLLSSILSLLPELDLGSLEVLNTVTRRRMLELEDSD